MCNVFERQPQRPGATGHHENCITLARVFTAILPRVLPRQGGEPAELGTDHPLLHPADRVGHFAASPWRNQPKSTRAQHRVTTEEAMTLQYESDRQAKEFAPPVLAKNGW